jgi:hypothetical protein
MTGGCVGSVGLRTQESRTTTRVPRLEYYPEVDPARCWHGRHRRLDSDCGFVVVVSGLRNESWHRDRLYGSTENIDRTIWGISSPSPEAMHRGAGGGKDPWFLAMYVLEPLRGKRGLEVDAMSARISVPARAERAKEVESIGYGFQSRRHERWRHISSSKLRQKHDSGM